jgi:hypothetical protein
MLGMADIVDWIMEPGSDEAYRDQLQGDLAYLFNNSYHGRTAKRSIEGPQICTKARELSPRVIQGKDFVAVTSSFKYTIAAPGKKTGSEWNQTLVFPAGQRYFVSIDKITSVASEAMFLRLDMPGHISTIRATLSAKFTSATQAGFHRVSSSKTLRPTRNSIIAATSIRRPNGLFALITSAIPRPDAKVPGWRE